MMQAATASYRKVHRVSSVIPAGIEESPMHVPSTIRLNFGPACVPIRASIRVTLATHELHTLAREIAREADAARAEGRHETADRLDWRAADLREAAR